MGFDDRDLGAWSVRDSGELWRKPFRLGASLSQVSLCVTDDHGELDKSTSLRSHRKHYKLPPRSPRNVAALTPKSVAQAPSEPKLELTIRCLSPRTSISTPPAEGNDGNAQKPVRKSVEKSGAERLRKSLEFSPRRWPALNGRNKLEKVQTEKSMQISGQKTQDDAAKENLAALTNRSFLETTNSTSGSFQDEDNDDCLFSNLENQKDMLTDESEMDFWDCQKEEEESSYFDKSSRTDIPTLHLDNAKLDDTTMICTLNGERVVMQTNIAFQHTEQELSGYAQASREYLESQQHMMNYFEELHADDQEEFARKQDSTDRKDVCQQVVEQEEQLRLSVSSKRRWPRITKIRNAPETGIEACLSARSIASSKASSRRSRHSKSSSKRSGKPVIKKMKNNESKKERNIKSLDVPEAEVFPETQHAEEQQGNHSLEQETERVSSNEKQKIEKQDIALEQTQECPCPEAKVWGEEKEEVLCSELIDHPKGNVASEGGEVRCRADEEKEPLESLDSERIQAINPKQEVLSRSPTPQNQSDNLKSTVNVVEEELRERNSLSAEKVSSILSFLKQVESANLPDSAPRTDDDAVSLADSTFTAPSLVPEEEVSLKVKPADLAFSGIRIKIHELKEKIMKQKHRITELEEEKENIRSEKNKEIVSEREKYSKELQDQAQEYKAAIKKHLSISEKLMKDKEALSERLCGLTMAEAKFEEKMKAAKQEWAYELKRQKEAWNAGEKARREAWIEKKTKEIKEMTIVGLEPHIETIHENHRKELEALQQRHAEEVKIHLQKQSIKHREEMTEMREQMLKERDEILDKERLAAHARISEMAEKFEQQALQQRMRIASDLAQQLERSEASRRDDKQYTQELLARCQKEAAEREETLRRQHEKAIDDLQTKAHAEISALKLAWDLEKTEWEHDLTERVLREVNKREPEIEARCYAERNKEIEMIIDKLEKEKEEIIAEHRKERTIRVDELLQEKRTLLKKLKENEAHYMDLCKSVLEGKAHADAERSELNSRMDDLKADIRNQDVIISRLKEQIENSKQEANKQKEKLEASLAKQEQQTKATALELQKSHAEVDQIRIRKVEALAELENKVKVAIEKKDEIISGLRNQLESAHHQIRHTEQLLTLQLS